MRVQQTTTSTVGRFIREQRENAQLSLREMARMASISNAYLSQIERGLHMPSVRVLRSLAEALDVPLENLVDSTGEHQRDTGHPDVEAAIRNDPQLDRTQRAALLAVYRSYVRPTVDTPAAASSPDHAP